MPKYMDVHNIAGGIDAATVAAIHAKDLEHQKAHGVQFLKYWLDEEQGKVFCLSEAPDASAPNAVHQEANGIMADEVYEVGEFS
ncbi:DUF4242 domain-containing protein [Demequina salsinemoris]|uniref:DUF4242 domain-containing protein n=1 Tax=Demequina salsinemoris TaxID=577470 RepID=UPI0007815A48|nr:DUF4242 domain-containing protein [Demequina salsinemoris]